MNLYQRFARYIPECLCIVAVMLTLRSAMVQMVDTMGYILMLLWCFVLVAWFAIAIAWLSSSIKSWRVKRSIEPQHQKLRQLLLIPFVSGITLVLADTPLPLRAAFCLSRPALSNLAQKVITNQISAEQAKQRAGLYYVENIEHSPGCVYFTVGRDGFITTGEDVGFAYFSSGSAPPLGVAYGGDYSKLTILIDLGGHWYWWKRELWADL